MSYSFRDREVAEELKRIANRNRGLTNNPRVPTGCEIIIAKAPEGGVTAATEPEGMDPENMGSGECTIMYIDTSGGDPVLAENADVTFTVYNKELEAIEEGTVFYAVRTGVHWVAMSRGGESQPLKRCKFVLTGKVMNAGVGYWADADIVDPMNSGLAIGTGIKVRDPHKQFPFGIEGCMGIAHFSKLDAAIYPEGPNPPDTYTAADQGQWLIEQCDQLVNKAKAVTTGGIVAWEPPSSVSNINIQSSESYWPFIHWAAEDESVLTGVENDKNFTANPGFIWLERRVVEVEEPDETNYETPVLSESYDEVEWQWHITGVEKPVARYAETQFNGTEFEVIGSGGGGSPGEGEEEESGGSFYEGYSPENHLIFTDLGGSHIDAFDPLPCSLANDEKGIAFLDDKAGTYRTFATISAMYGTARRVNMVGEVLEGSPSKPTNSPTEGPIGTTSETGCGEFTYNYLKNVFVFGNPDTSYSDCRLEYQEPPVMVDTNANAEDVTVITGTTTNSEGELEFLTKTIKACPEDGANIPVSYNTTDVVTDIYCADGSVTKEYKQIKYIGSDVAGSSNSVELPCTNPSNYNWETIFNNHIYNQDWWNVSYYDITYPDGCQPCPTGCCTGGDYDGLEVTQADCEGSGGTWTEGPCSGGGDYQGCCTITSDQGSTLTYDTTTTQDFCNNLVGETVIFDGNAETVASANWTQSAGPCGDGGGNNGGGGDCTGSTCCCGNVSDVLIEAGGAPDPGEPGGGGGGGSYTFTQTSGGTGDGSCTWAIVGEWDIDGNITIATLTLSHTGGGCFSVSGTAPDGSSVSGDSCTGNVTVGSATGSFQLFHDEEDACVNGN